MKKQNKFLLAVVSLQLIAFTMSSSALATTGKVIKSKGKKVLVELPIDPKLQPGDTIELDTLELRSPAASRSSGSGGRRLTLGGSTNGGELHFYSQNNGYPGSTLLSVNGRGGWNYTKYEYGPIASLSYLATDSNNSLTQIGVGGFFDWNMVPNVPGANDVYGVGGDVQISSISTKSGGTSTSAGGLNLNGGGFYKFFLFRSDTCLRFDADLHIGLYDKYSETGLKFLAGLQTYF